MIACRWWTMREEARGAAPGVDDLRPQEGGRFGETGPEGPPRITHLSWGTVETEGGERYKDAKLFPGGSREWDWTDTGTSHDPGIQVADVQELLDHDAQEIILGCGMNERLQVQDKTIEHLEGKGVAVHVLQTEEAVETYNQLAAEGRPVGMLVHSTC